MVLTLNDALQPQVHTAGHSNGAEIVNVLHSGERLLVVHRDGIVATHSAATLEAEQEDKRCNEVTSAALLPWIGSARLLLATEERGLLCIGLDDELVSQYLAPYGGLRDIAAADDVVAGITSDRQRLLLWNTWSPRQPAGDLFIASLAKHRAADVAI
jgi:hypothetical protein